MAITAPTPNATTPVHDVENEIDSQWTNILTLFEDLRNASHPARDEKLVKTTDNNDLSKLRALAVPGSSLPLMDVVKEAYTIFDCRMRTNHPMFFGFIPSNATGLAWLGDMFVSAFNTHAGGHVAGSGPCAVETELIGWLASKTCFPPSAGGIFVSGGSIANLMAIVVASDQMLQQTDRSKGVIYIGDQAHYSLTKVARILGFSENRTRKIQSNSMFRMQVRDLERQIIEDRDRGLIPFLIIGSYGCTETGAIDPIEELADVAREQTCGCTWTVPLGHQQPCHTPDHSWLKSWLALIVSCGMPTNGFFRRTAVECSSYMTRPNWHPAFGPNLTLLIMLEESMATQPSSGT